MTEMRTDTAFPDVARGLFTGTSRRHAIPWLLAASALLVLLLAACSTPDGGKQTTIRLVTGSENRLLQQQFDDFAKKENVEFQITYQGSVDTMLELQSGAEQYDIVWPASSIWISLGDRLNVVSDEKSIMRTPVVFGVKRSVAESLGWVGTDVTVEDILAAAESGQLRYMTSSATQSNSGAMAYLGYLYAFAGHPEVLTSEMLQDPALAEKTKRMLETVDRSAGASGFLRDLFVDQYDQFDGMVNNESAIINANQELSQQGREPLYVIYPVDGLAIADWPMAFVDHADPELKEKFTKFQEYFLSEEIQRALLAQGRRTDLAMNADDADPAVFNPEWGIDVTRVIQPIRMPTEDVILEALTLYQTTFRKPSLTVYCLDYSGSMEGQPERDLESAMQLLLDPEISARYMLQPSDEDITIVIPFNDDLIAQWAVTGNDPVALKKLLVDLMLVSAGGGTDIYRPAAKALEVISEYDLEEYSVAVILMTDGKSNEGSANNFKLELTDLNGEVPVYSIMFGDADQAQLAPLADISGGHVFDGRDDLIAAFRQAKGYN